MKIWITRDTTGSLHGGGLERCTVWFVKPIYRYYSRLSIEEQDAKIPWGLNSMSGVGRWGWEPALVSISYVKETNSVSFGKLFGYGEQDKDHNPNHIPGLAEYVWSKLKEHYGDTEFPHGWYEYEKAGKCLIEDFLLEIELNIIFTM